RPHGGAPRGGAGGRVLGAVVAGHGALLGADADRAHRTSPFSLRATIIRALKLTAKVMTNSTRPVAMSTLTPTPVASGKLSAMLAAIVLGAVPETRSKLTMRKAERTSATAIVSPSARPRPSMTAETMPERE